MATISNLTRGKKVLCNPPVFAIATPEMCAKIDSAEAMIELGYLDESVVLKLIEADEAYLAVRRKCDADWAKRYEAALAVALDRLEEANVAGK